MRAPTSATIGERTAGIARALYVAASRNALSSYGRWSRMFLAESPTGCGVARVGRASRDVRRERESESNDDCEDETTDRHQWASRPHRRILSLGPSWRLSRRGARK